MPISPPNLSGATWHKSSYSGGGGGSDCVEVATGLPHVVPVRDSKDPQGPALLFTPDAWASFLTTVKSPEFTVPSL